MTSLSTSTVSVRGKEPSQDEGMQGPTGQSYSSKAVIQYIPDTGKSTWLPALLLSRMCDGPAKHTPYKLWYSVLSFSTGAGQGVLLQVTLPVRSA